MNKTLYQDANLNAIRISEFETFAGETMFNHLAVKFVIEGEETYHVNGKKFILKNGDYLIGNNSQISEVFIKQKTRGLCIDVSYDIIKEIATTWFGNHSIDEFLLTDKFLLNKYSARHTACGNMLGEISSNISAHPLGYVPTSECIYSLGEKIIRDQSTIFQQYSKLNFRKQLVRQETLRSLLNIKSYIDDCFTNQLTIEELSTKAHMSKYAFIRQFKTAFGVTPYHYIAQRRLHFSKVKLRSGQPVQEVALLVGYADTASFSKAFKTYFGMAPSACLK